MPLPCPAVELFLWTSGAGISKAGHFLSFKIVQPKAHARAGGGDSRFNPLIMNARGLATLALRAVCALIRPHQIP
jgi:hypothetical protein